MIEDVIIHESFNTILWLMIVVGKDEKFKIKKYMVKYLLGVVYLLTVNKKKLIIKESCENLNLIELLNSIKNDNINKNIINSLCLRYEYGGLKGDIFEDSITKPQTPYGQSKLKSENICHEYIKLGQNVTILRPAIVYGPDSELWVNRICKRSIPLQAQCDFKLLWRTQNQRLSAMFCANM